MALSIDQPGTPQCRPMKLPADISVADFDTLHDAPERWRDIVAAIAAELARRLSHALPAGVTMIVPTMPLW
jgi:hypothetical protein